MKHGGSSFDGILSPSVSWFVVASPTLRGTLLAFGSFLSFESLRKLRMCRGLLPSFCGVRLHGVEMCNICQFWAARKTSAQLRVENRLKLCLK
jgi:hypothetical protein